MNIFQEVFASVDKRTNDLLHNDEPTLGHLDENEDMNNAQKAKSLKIERKKEKTIQNFKKFNSTSDDRKTKSFQIKKERSYLIPQKIKMKSEEIQERECNITEADIVQKKAHDAEIILQIEKLKQQIKQAKSQLKGDKQIIASLEKENTQLHAQISKSSEICQNLADQYNLIALENEDKIAEMEELLEFQYQEKTYQIM